MVVSAAVGVVGLEATYAAVRAGKHVALSNKEVLVAAGELVMAAVAAEEEDAGDEDEGAEDGGDDGCVDI